MNKLWVRLSLAFLLVAWLAIGAVALIVRSSTANSFRQYVNQRATSGFDSGVVTRLEEHYAETGTWQNVEALLPGPKQGAGQGLGRGSSNGRGGAKVLLADPSGTVVASNDPAALGTVMQASTREYATPLEVNGTIVGWLAQETPSTQVLGAAENNFLQKITSHIVLAAVGAALLAVIIGGALAWQLTRPMRLLTNAAHGLAAGNLGQQVPAKGTAEIAELAHAFNTMSRDLAAGETLRQRMAADIAHELRTPVSVLRGHLEAMLDGVFPMDGEHLAVAYDQTIHLGRLVDDLRLLTRAEAGHLPLEKVSYAPGDLAARALDNFAPLARDANITLSHTIAPDLPPIVIDVDRMQQVLGNLLTNALRHTPPKGTIALEVQAKVGNVRFSVSNTGQGLTPEQAAQVFTPFWRAEDARERDHGGSGLGLAITRQLVTLHNGRIWVESTPQRTTFIFEIPAVKQG